MSEEWPLALMTGRLRDQWHTMTRTGKAARLFAHIPEPVVSLHPDDAGAIEPGGFAAVESRWGSGMFRARLDPGMRPGAVFVPMHWTARFCRAARSNAAISPAADPISGQAELKHTPVRVRAWAPAWHGFTLGPVALGQDAAAWCAAIPVGPGLFRHELAGEGAGEADRHDHDGERLPPGSAVEGAAAEREPRDDEHRERRPGDERRGRRVVERDDDPGDRAHDEHREVPPAGLLRCVVRKRGHLSGPSAPSGR